MPAKGKVACTIAMLLTIAGTVCAQTATDREIAAVFAAEANSLYNRGEYPAAVEVARRGLQFAADNSDLHALAAMALYRSSSSVYGALASFERAFSLNRFTRLERTDVAAVHGALLDRIGRHAEVLALIGSLGVDTMLYPDLLYLEARALFALQRVSAAETRASIGVRIYLEDPRFYRLLLERQPQPGYRDYLTVRRYEAADPEYLRLLFSYARRIPAGAHRREVVERYFELGGSDPAAALLLLAHSDDQTADLERFRRLGGMREHDLLVEAYAAIDQRLRQGLVDEFAAFNGRLIVDRDRNGVAEKTLHYSDGNLVRWQIDSAQDGLFDYEIVFDNRRPRAVEQRGTAGFNLLRYGNYPEVRSIRFEENGWSVYYPIADRLEILVLDPELGWTAAQECENGGADGDRCIPDALRAIALHPQGLLIDRGAIERNAAFVESYRDGSDRPFRVTELSDGVPIRSAEDRLGDGAVDHVLIFRDGVALEGMRDLDGDGRFEVLEEYRNGELVRLSVSLDRGRVAQFYHEFGDVEILSWDFDRDGTLDVEERYFQDELILRRYAGGGDGVFDLSIRFMGEILGAGDE